MQKDKKGGGWGISFKIKNTRIEGATDCRAATSITIEQKQQQKEIKIFILREQWQINK